MRQEAGVPRLTRARRDRVAPPGATVATPIWIMAPMAIPLTQAVRAMEAATAAVIMGAPCLRTEDTRVHRCRLDSGAGAVVPAEAGTFLLVGIRPAEVDTWEAEVTRAAVVVDTAVVGDTAAVVDTVAVAIAKDLCPNL
jgi:hypothetical protein